MNVLTAALPIYIIAASKVNHYFTSINQLRCCFKFLIIYRNIMAFVNLTILLLITVVKIFAPQRRWSPYKWLENEWVLVTYLAILFFYILISGNYSTMIKIRGTPDKIPGYLDVEFNL